MRLETRFIKPCDGSSPATLIMYDIGGFYIFGDRLATYKVPTKIFKMLAKDNRNEINLLAT